MAAITITEANIEVGPVTPITSTAGEALTSIQPLYRKSTDGKMYKALRGGTEEEAKAEALSLFKASADGTVLMLRSGDTVFLGSGVLTPGPYVVGDAGEIRPFSDLVTGNRLTLVGTARSTSELKIQFDATGATIP